MEPEQLQSFYCLVFSQRYDGKSQQRKWVHKDERVLNYMASWIKHFYFLEILLYFPRQRRRRKQRLNSYNLVLAWILGPIGEKGL